MRAFWAMEPTAFLSWGIWRIAAYKHSGSANRRESWSVFTSFFTRTILWLASLAQHSDGMLKAAEVEHFRTMRKWTVSRWLLLQREQRVLFEYSRKIGSTSADGFLTKHYTGIWIAAAFSSYQAFTLTPYVVLCDTVNVHLLTTARYMSSSPTFSDTLVFFERSLSNKYFESSIFCLIIWMWKWGNVSRNKASSYLGQQLKGDVVLVLVWRNMPWFIDSRAWADPALGKTRFSLGQK